MHKRTFSRIALLTLLSPAVLISSAGAYGLYSEVKDADTGVPTGNCADCHGDFRAENYPSKDGVPWTAIQTGTTTVITSLHDIHRRNMGIPCSACHTAAGLPGQVVGETRYPVALDSSDGILVDGVQQYTNGCLGCHGRAESQNENKVRGQGLRFHHIGAAGATPSCNVTGCHDKTYAPDPENKLPPYFAFPDATRPTKPFDSCNPEGNENFAGSARGLDNDGNGVYDMADPFCLPAEININPGALDFGPEIVPEGTSKTVSTVIENSGAGTLYVKLLNRCVTTSTEYTWSPVYLAVAPGASQNLDVTYAPVDDGIDTGCLEIINNDPDEAKTTTLNVSAKGSRKSGLLPLYIPAIIKPAAK